MGSMPLPMGTLLHTARLLPGRSAKSVKQVSSTSRVSPLPPWPPPCLLAPRSGGEIRWTRRGKEERVGERTGVIMQRKIAKQGVF